MERSFGPIPDRDLSYFVEGTEHFADYVEAVSWAQDYAMTNRREMMRLVVEALRGVPEGRRGAQFVCVLALVGAEGPARLFEGRCAGRLALEPRGRGGFGYDPLFVPEGFEATLAEMEPAQKNRLSHRGRAWAACAAWLAAGS